MRPLVDPVSPLRRNPRAIFFDRVAPAAVFLAALAARLYYVLELQRTPLFERLSLDPLYYYRWAVRIAAGDWLSGHKVFEQSPLYAYILAGIFKEAGKGLLVPRLVQCVAGAAACVLVFFIARKLFGRPASLVAGLLFAVYAPGIFYDGMIMKTSYAVLLTAAMTAALVYSEASRRGLLLLGGLLLGLAALVRDNLILLAPLLALWLVVDLFVPPIIRAGRGREAAARVSVFLAGVALAVLPVTARNFFAAGDYVLLTSGGGEVFYLGNNPEADGTYVPPPFVRAESGVEHQDFRDEAARRLGRAVTRREASSYWLGQGLKYIEENPADWLRLMGRKLLVFLNAYELPDNENFDHHRAFVSFLGVLPTWAVLLPLALAGAFVSAGRWKELLPVYLIAGGYAATVLLFFNFARFRMPLTPLAAAFAGEAVIELPGLLRRSAWSMRTAAALCALAGGAALALIPLQSDPLHDGQSSAQMADLLLEAGRTGEALAASKKGLSLLERVYQDAGGKPGPDGGVAPSGNPGRPGLGASYYGVLMEAYLGRSRVEGALHHEEEAAKFIRRAAAAAPDDEVGYEALVALGRLELKEGHVQEALQTLRRARAVNKEAMIPLLLYAEALHREGRLREAVELVENALVSTPKIDDLTLADADYGLGLMYKELGDKAKMTFYFDETLAKNPNHPRAAWMRRMVDEAERSQ